MAFRSGTKKKPSSSSTRDAADAHEQTSLLEDDDSNKPQPPFRCHPIIRRCLTFVMAFVVALVVCTLCSAFLWMLFWYLDDSGPWWSQDSTTAASGTTDALPSCGRKSVIQTRFIGKVRIQGSGNDTVIVKNGLASQTLPQRTSIFFTLRLVAHVPYLLI